MFENKWLCQEEARSCARARWFVIIFICKGRWQSAIRCICAKVHAHRPNNERFMAVPWTPFSLPVKRCSETLELLIIASSLFPVRCRTSCWVTWPGWSSSAMQRASPRRVRSRGCRRSA